MATARQLEHRKTDLYEQDFLAWIESQAGALRSRQVDSLDWDNLVEEIESMGRSQRNELKSRLRTLLMHLIKWHWQPEKRSPSCQLTIKEQRLSLRDLFEMSPSLRPSLPLLVPKAWQDASSSAALETGLKESLFPETCPWPLEDVLLDGWLPD
ncbi:MAG: DUF29 domain-containing protein [Acidithiobacillus sp.]